MEMLKVVSGIMLDYSVDVQLRVLSGLLAVLGKEVILLSSYNCYYNYVVHIILRYTNYFDIFIIV